MLVFDTYQLIDGMTDCMKKPIRVKAKQIHEPFLVQTLEGNHNGKPGDYLMKGVDWELYVCDRAIFEKTYDFLIPLTQVTTAFEDVRKELNDENSCGCMKNRGEHDL